MRKDLAMAPLAPSTPVQGETTTTSEVSRKDQEMPYP